MDWRLLTISEAQRRTELFLTGQMLEALRAVEYGLPALIPSCTDVDLAEIARARVEIRHVRGASDATYLINAFGEELLMQLQLNAHRLVVVYRVPALDALDASTLAVRLCQCLPPYQTVDAAFTAVAALAHPEVRAGNPSRSLTRVMRRWRQKITFSRRIRRGEGGHYRRPSSRLRSSH